jgi:cytochrome c-type biogenesis protein CcmH/NrfF
MAKAKLPKQLRDEIKELLRKGYSSDRVYGMVIDKAKGYVNSHEELRNCITSLEGKVTLED